MHFTEDDFENAILELFREQLGYDYVYSPNVIRDYAEPLYVEVLEAMLPQINRGLPQAAIDEAMVKIRTYEGGTLVQKNELFTDYLQNGVAVNYFDGREQCSANVRLVDYDSPLHNRFTIANQWTVDGHSVRRAAMIVFVNDCRWWWSSSNRPRVRIRTCRKLMHNCVTICRRFRLSLFITLFE